MRIAIYWEQESWGGVDTHLLELLSNWPDPVDEFVLFYNVGNQGFERVRPYLERLRHVRCIGVLSCSHNELVRRFRTAPGYRFFLRYLIYGLRPLTFLMMARRLKRVFTEAGRFDLLLSDNGGYPGSLGCISALVAATQAGIGARVLLVHHEATRPAPFMGWFERYVDHVVTTQASVVACVSDATRQSLLERRTLDSHLVRFRIIHHGIVATTEAVERVDLRRLAGAAEDDLLIGIAGRVEAYKGHEDLIFALARLDAGARRRLKLLVIGTGEPEEQARLERLAVQMGVRDRVAFLGYCPGRPADFIAQLDLLVVATRGFEGFGLTILEAMQVGTPVLATRIGAIPEFVDESTGWLVAPGSPQELAEALNDFMRQRQEWQQRTARAQDRAKRLGSLMVREYHRLLAEAVALNS